RPFVEFQLVAESETWERIESVKYGEEREANVKSVSIDDDFCMGAATNNYHQRRHIEGIVTKVADKDEGVADDENSTLLEEMLCQETVGRGRPKALCYEDISLTALCHPTTIENVLCMAVKLIHHKGVDSKPKPTIFFFTTARKVIFCPITIIISLALRDNPFDAPGLNNAQRVLQIRNFSPEISKREWKAAGIEEDLDLKAFRRMAANGVNGKATDTVRDQVMRHDPEWATFNSAYINEKVQFHVQNVVLDEPLEDELIQFWSHMRMTRDPRASSDMVPNEVWRNIQPDPEIENLKDQRRGEKVKGRYRKYYFQNLSTWDIERRLRGEVEDDEEYMAPAINLYISERAELANILIHQRDDLSLEELHSLCVRAAELMTILNDKRETVKHKHIQRSNRAVAIV
ncbi:domain containing, partial [Trichoderma arundinaceum]